MIHAPPPDAAAADTGFPASRRRLEAALADPALRTRARFLLWEVCQACGDPVAAIEHLRLAIAADPLQRPCPAVDGAVDGAAPLRTVLALATPGDLQANLPLGMLLDAGTQLFTLWIEGTGRELPPLPPVDCVFVAIGEDERHRAALAEADRVAQAIGRPTINSGARIAALSRDGVCRLLRGLEDVLVPDQRRLDRAGLRGNLRQAPFIARPVGSHAGIGLGRIDDADDLDGFLDDHPDGRSFFAAPFIDYRSADGLFRKYRVVFVDRVPYPVHLAIHDHWAVWYYNARMERFADRRAEEARFLRDMDAATGPRAVRALRALGRRLDLDYVGLDCAVLPDGRLLVFEVETAMLVHDRDPARRAATRRIVEAVNAMLDRRIGSAAVAAA